APCGVGSGTLWPVDGGHPRGAWPPPHGGRPGRHDRRRCAGLASPGFELSMSEARKPLLRDPNAPAADSDTSFLWSDARLLGYQPMDDVHKEFYEVTFGLLVCTDETAGAALEAFAQHAQSHFDQED